jgi:hypothetical protein
VCGSDGLINVDYKRKDDSNLWYFVKDFSANPIDVSKSKNKLLGFNLFGFVGNFSNLNKLSNPLVVLVGPSGLTAQTKPNLFEFKTKYLIGLNSHIFDGPIDLIIKNITQIKILGDWTRGNETIGLDNIFIL